MDKDVRSSSVTCRGAFLSVRATGPYQDEMAAAVILNTGGSMRRGVLIDNREVEGGQREWQL